MVRRKASRGLRSGQHFWGCSTFPQCRGTIDIAGVMLPQGNEPASVSLAGTSAQAEFERRLGLRRARLRQVWPFLVGLTLVVMVATYLAVQGWLGPSFGALAAFGVALLFGLTAIEIPQTTRAWQRGAEGERRTARHLAGLGEAGFVVLHDRRVPGYGGNLDHVAIGPSGVWAIETKRLSGKVVIDGSHLSIGGGRQDKIVDQVFREAAAVQIALRDQLDPLGMTVVPVICLHDAELPWFKKTVRGVRLASGRQLVRLLAGGEQRLTPEQVQQLAGVASVRLK